MSPVCQTLWQEATATQLLRDKDVHLWRFPLVADLGDEAILSDDEKSRIKRLRAPGKALSFLVARTSLRHILSRYINISPEKLKFKTGEFGKPSLIDDGLSFNLSHSGRWGVCAVAKDYALGVDVEAINPQLDFLPLARRFFSPEEQRWLGASVQARQRRNFFRLWTRKEAWLKGKGKGFSDPDLQLAPVHLSVTPSEGAGWWLRNLPVERCYVGALAVRGKVERVEKYQLSSACRVLNIPG